MALLFQSSIPNIPRLSNNIMRTVLSLGLMLLSLTVQGQSMTVDQVKQQMVQLFEVLQDTADGESYRYEDVVKLPPNHAFADLAKNNTQYTAYIKTNYSTTDFIKIRSSNADMKQVNTMFHQALEQDSLYNRYALEMAYYYLRAKGIQVVNYTPVLKQTVSKAEMMKIASRFFYAHSVEEAPDSIGFHVCVGMNGYEHNRQLLTNPLLEAFCFMALFQNLHSPNYQYWSFFKQQVKRIRDKYRTMLDPVQRIEEDRREMYKLMQNDKELERALLTEYSRKRSMLNFVLENP